MAGKRESTTILVIVALIAAYFIWTSGADSPAPSDDPSPAASGCSEDDVTFNAKMSRLGKEGTTLGAGYNYYILTDGIGSVAGATTQDVPPNYAMQVMFGENSTTYYTVVKTVDTCETPHYEKVQLALADTSLNSYYLKNADGSVNSASNDQAMGADDSFETTVTIKAGADTYFGNPNSECENIGVVEYDKTYILSAVGDDPVAVPGSFTYRNVSYDGANAFIIPKTGDGEEASFNIAIESTATQPTGLNDPYLTIYDCDIDKNEDTLALIEGVEDEDLNSIALASQTLQVHLS